MFFSPEDLKEKIKNKIFNDVISASPAFIVFSDWIGNFQESMIFQAFQEKYRYFGNFDCLVLYVRIDYPYQLDKNSESYRLLTTVVWNELGTARLLLAENTKIEEIAQQMSAYTSRRQFQSVASNDPYAVKVRQGIQLAQKGKWGEAFGCWVEAQQINRFCPEVLGNIGIYHERLGSYYLAMQHYQGAYSYLGSPWDDYYRAVHKRLILQAYARERKFQSSPRFRRDLAYAHGDSEYAQWVAKGNQEAMAYRWLKAKSLWGKAVKKYPEYAEARANLGIYYEIHKNYNLALIQYAFAAKHLAGPWQQYYQDLKMMIMRRQKANY